MNNIIPDGLDRTWGPQQTQASDYTALATRAAFILNTDGHRRLSSGLMGAKNVYGNSLFVLTEAAKGVPTKHDPTRHVTGGTSSIMHALDVVFFPAVRVKGLIFPVAIDGHI